MLMLKSTLHIFIIEYTTRDSILPQPPRLNGNDLYTQKWVRDLHASCCATGLTGIHNLLSE